MPLVAHTRIGRFEILALIGAGGMGEVYRARDTRLGRDVAIKVLPASLHANQAAIERFGQEARAASALNHAAILTVFDAGTEDGQPYLVTELLEGSTLRHRLALGPIPFREALDIAVQASSGLGAAHLVGIVHRDVKPENLFLTRGNTVKILDFGVARLVDTTPDFGSAETAAATAPGSVIGTVGYMAPEQARGAAVDCRADVFAFGCVLYEMLSGQRTFKRATPVDTIASIMMEDPPALPESRRVPPSVERIVKRCLRKDPAERFQSAVDLAFALTSAREDLSAKAPTAPRSGRALQAAALVALVASATLGSWLWMSTPAVTPALAIDAVSVVPPSAKPISPALSPDGKWVAYISVAESQPQLWVQMLNGGVPVNLTRGTDIPVTNRTIIGGIDISPDGGAIGLAGRPRASGLWSIPGVWTIPAPLGGPARLVTDRFASVRWSPDGRMFAAVLANPLVGDAIVVSGTDGQDERVIVPAGGGLHLHQVAWSPDGHYLYYAQTLEPNHTLSEIYRARVDGGPPERIVRSPGVAIHPAPTPDGTAVVYAGNHSGEGLNIWWHPLDGSPERRLTAGAGEYTEPYVSRDGRALVCLARRRKGELVRIDVDEPGSPTVTTIGTPGSGDGEPSLSANPSRLFISSARSGRRNIWSSDLSGGQLLPLTSGDSLDRGPVVSPDERAVAFISDRGGKRGIWIVPSGGGTPRLVAEGAVLDRVTWSSGSTRVIYALGGGAKATLWMVAATGGAPMQIPGASGRAPAASPIGDVIAVARSDNDRPALHFLTSSGTESRKPLSIEALGLPTAIAWSPDANRIALINLPGRAAAEVWVLTLADGTARKLVQFEAPAELDGITWTADGRALIVGRIDYETEVLLLRGLPDARR